MCLIFSGSYKIPHVDLLLDNRKSSFDFSFISFFILTQQNNSFTGFVGGYIVFLIFNFHFVVVNLIFFLYVIACSHKLEGRHL